MPTTSLLQVTRTLVDILAEPRFNAERISQAFFGEMCTFLEDLDEFVRICRHRDDYEGFVDRRHLTETTMPTGRVYQLRIASAEVTSSKSESLSPPYQVLFGSDVFSKSNPQTSEFVAIGADRRGRLKSRYLSKPVKADASLSWKSIVRNSRFFLGAPYLWGGISHLGCDCSGMVQTLYGQAGIPLPRDTKDQRKMGTSVQREKLEPGDLIFSPRHVVIYLGKGKILHSSRAYGGVAIQSLNPKDDTYRMDIDQQFEEARRVLPDSQTKRNRRLA